MSDVRLELPNRAASAPRCGHAFTITAALEPADWLAYFNAIAITSEQQARSGLHDGLRLAPHAARRALITAAEGYKVEGGVDITTLPNWIDRRRWRIAVRSQPHSRTFGCRPRSRSSSSAPKVRRCRSTLPGPSMRQPEDGRLRGPEAHLQDSTQAQQKRYNQAACAPSWSADLAPAARSTPRSRGALRAVRRADPCRPRYAVKASR